MNFMLISSRATGTEMLVNGVLTLKDSTVLSGDAFCCSANPLQFLKSKFSHSNVEGFWSENWLVVSLRTKSSHFWN